MSAIFESVCYLGHSAVLIKGSAWVAIDPWLSENPTCPPNLKDPERLDLIVLTHGHSDHAGDCLRLAKQTGAKVVATFELAMLLKEASLPMKQIIPMNKGGSSEVAGIKISLSHAFHSNSFDSASGTRYAGEACSVILNDGNTVIFHAGDTALFSDLKLIGQFYKPDLAFLPIGDCFTMNPGEAALAAKWLGVKKALPIHYATFPQLTGTAQDFIAHCEEQEVAAVELKIGEDYPIKNLIS